MAINFDSIPKAMKTADRWVLWRSEEREGKFTKVPYQPNGKKASSVSNLTWSSFEAVKAAYEQGGYDGVGFVLGGGFVGIDLDHVIKNGAIDPGTAEDLKLLDSYAEFSPSGEGIHVICQGAFPESGRKDQGKGIEVYAAGRYFTVTGRKIEGYQAEPKYRTDELLEFYKKYFAEEPKPKQIGPISIDCNLTNDQIISLAAGAKNGDKFLKLMSGEWESIKKGDEQLYPSQSEADLGLCELITFYTTNPTQIDQIFRRSKLYRDKWERSDYREDTINLAIERTAEHYSGNGSEEAKTEPVSDQSPCDILELLRTFKKWLHIEEDYNVIAPTCAAIANFCPGDPDIIGLIQPSGSIKTEFIRSLGQSENQYVYPLSSLTEHTLVSGHKDSRDLVPLLNGRMICIKDFTTILAKKEDVRSQIFADLRELTDGYIGKEFGNGIKKEYQNIHSSILFASTNAIERYYTMYSNLGQRLIFLRPRNDPKAARERSFQNRGKQDEMRAELHQVMMRFLNTIIPKIKDGLPETPEDLIESMGELYDFLAIVRTPIHHDYKTGEIDELPEPEFPTRISNTIGRLIEVHALVHGREEVTGEDTAFGERIILDNIPTMRWKLLDALSDGWEVTPSIAKKADLSVGAVRYVLDELFCLKLIERLTREEKDNTQDRRSDSYKIADIWFPIIDKLKTRIIKESETESQLNEIINKQNTVSYNPCLLSCEKDGEQGIKAEVPKMGKIERPTPIKCAACDADLSGKGYGQKNGKFYCLLPGCFYPARGSSEAKP